MHEQASIQRHRCLAFRLLDQLKEVWLSNNQLTNVKGLEKLTQLKELRLFYNPGISKAQVAVLRKALPNCVIAHYEK